MAEAAVEQEQAEGAAPRPRCERCRTRPKGKSKRMCDACLERKREEQRARAGCLAWRPGGRGRPPLS